MNEKLEKKKKKGKKKKYRIVNGEVCPFFKYNNRWKELQYDAVFKNILENVEEI